MLQTENTSPPLEWCQRPLQVGDKVTINPTHSLKFANKQGTIVGIVKDDGLPIKISFEEKAIFGFHAEELIWI
jgi:hypothetical protein